MKPDDIRSVLARLVSTGNNWDGHGAIGPTPSAITTAWEILTAIGENPDVMPSVHGGIIIELEEADLIIDVDPDGSVALALGLDMGLTPMSVASLLAAIKEGL